MRDTAVGLVVGALLASLLVTWSRPTKGALGQSRPGVGVSEALAVIHVPTTDGGQRVLIVDKQQATMAVYDVGGASGRISLRSARNIRWDLSLDKFNSDPPDPDEVQAMLPGH